MDKVTQGVTITIGDPSQVAEARRRAVDLGRSVALDADGLNRLEIVVTELGTNMLRHGLGGEILVTSPAPGSVEVVALDRGPGIADLRQSMVDGVSSASTLGLGLGTIRRQSQAVSIFAPADKGTVVSALLQSADRHVQPDVAAICIPLRGESVCGDLWAEHHVGSRRIFFVADGLGHGVHAAEASQAAERIFHAGAGKALDEIMKQMHLALRSTRGAAVMLVSLDPDAQLVTWCGVGNISASLHREGSSKGLISDNGTVGHQLSRTRIREASWSPVDTLVMHSDGLTSRWRLDAFPGLLAKSRATIAGVLYRDFSRERDDRTVLVARVA